MATFTWIAGGHGVALAVDVLVDPNQVVVDVPVVILQSEHTCGTRPPYSLPTASSKGSTACCSMVSFCLA